MPARKVSNHSREEIRLWIEQLRSCVARLEVQHQLMVDFGIASMDIEAVDQTTRSINLVDKGCDHIERAVRKDRLQSLQPAPKKAVKKKTKKTTQKS